jgi:Flp pilus assembly pilin Flp
MLKVLLDRRAVTSIEYAMVAAALALVLFEVMQAPARALGTLFDHVLDGPSSHAAGG